MTIKLLWIGDSPAVTTGFGRVAQGMLENLYATGKYSISVLGINHDGGSPHRYEGMFRIYTARSMGNLFGYNRVDEVIQTEQPDVIFINNDLWVCKEYVKIIPENNRIITYSPVDACPVEGEWLDPLLKTNTRITTYTEFAKKEILSARNIPSIDILGHGVDTDEFYPIEDVRDLLVNIPKDAFIIQNVNRNQPRKRLDLWLKSCRLFLDRLPPSDRKNIYIYYHGMIKDAGWDLVTLANRWGFDDRFLITQQDIMSTANGVPLGMLCKIYNAADVHVLTSMGEGFGLSPFESAACGKAQIVPNHSACKELWEGKAPLIDVARWEVLSGGINTEGGAIDIDNLASIYNTLYFNRDELKRYSKLAYNYVQQEQFTWGYLGKKLDGIIADTLSDDKWLSKKYQ